MTDDEYFGEEDFSSVNFDDAEAEGNEFENYSAEDASKESTVVDLEGVKIDRIIVDGWRTKAHGETVGIRQKEQWQARSRKFTEATVIKGKITYYDVEHREDGEVKTKVPREEVFTINAFFWRTDEKSALFHKFGSKKLAEMNRKLIIKTFITLSGDDPNSGRWTGSLEQSLIDSLCQTFGERKSKEGHPVFVVTAPGIQYQVRISRTHSVIGEEFVFPIIDYKTGETRIIMINEKRGTPGKDFNVSDCATGIKLADLDEKKLDIGGKVEINFDTSTELGARLAKNFLFRRILTLFSAAIFFLDDCYDSIKALRRALEAGQKVAKIKDDAERKAKLEELKAEFKFVPTWEVTKHELSLHFNPRRIRM
ncbi:MAG: hypothetical protein Kow0069_24900 [Promethearchaeota archaeon]